MFNSKYIILLFKVEGHDITRQPYITTTISLLVLLYIYILVTGWVDPAQFASIQELPMHAVHIPARYMYTCKTIMFR